MYRKFPENMAFASKMTSDFHQIKIKDYYQYQSCIEMFESFL